MTSQSKKIQSALVSVYHKDNLEPIVRQLHALNVKIYSTGGTLKFIQDLNIPAIAVESTIGFPEILDGRVKTLHPVIFGGILARRDNPKDMEQLAQHNIGTLDLVIVDLYPFEDTVKSSNDEAEIIEKIDIGGISLIRATAKNFNDTLIVSDRNQYAELLNLLNEKQGSTDLSDRKYFAAKAFMTSSHYDTAIFNYFNQEAAIPAMKVSHTAS
ncbi:MAG: bifunctional phosphoribosylaminoimidazolecarboxamide formyltransferase/IMP cyclohydrolase PurH, partial [Bacteroidetes bacterium]|nr:bifunctional phosphoribosylaminoimidazolecarboxamide formyltransferase/IMP cyclohydrolase PurH [Bacteroidota bacterium]